MQAATITDTGARILRPHGTAGTAAPAPRLRSRRPQPRGMGAGLYGVGAALPERVVGNDHFEGRLDTDDAWIVRRTGIRTRRWLARDEPLAPLAAQACIEALADAGRTADEVDQLIV